MHGWRGKAGCFAWVGRKARVACLACMSPVFFCFFFFFFQEEKVTGFGVIQIFRSGMNTAETEGAGTRRPRGEGRRKKGP